MSPVPSTRTALVLLLAGLSSAAVLPEEAARRHEPVARGGTPTKTLSPRDPSAAAAAVAAAAVTPSVSLPVACDFTYCDGSSSWCFYWAGVTAYDSKGAPIPGETRTNLGPCGAATTATPR
ncbi:hypothetical protein JDV02_001069 [Purpureocillium takamizusanense]|uniref:Uncharacterized protein n=1 Tax=Purpureocillium takamizusanense TaxID=2060973 RepID=A0A9Q8Q7F7_9HYPO|nr:uncharacterized protein JDV02_001069 [Purpureocillium takamizusanense]UNI14440.1 hypothetical protein JDV02_001069 [Purpureocillium takamizusanense]